MSAVSHDRIRSPSGQSIDSTRRKQPSQQPRQLLSCTKCRERKVKCDRTKPCSACCARGAPKECHFVAEGGDYAPIQQSYELRKLRAENLRLKERLRTSRISIDDEDSEQSADSQPTDRPSASSTKRRTTRQKRFQGSEWSDSIYFGSPGLANIVADFASVNLTCSNTQNLAHHLPRGSDMFTPKLSSTYPFATLFPATPEQCIPQLLDILPSRKELLEYLTAFEKRVYVCAFPHLPVELTKNEIERFLSDAERNSRMCPDMLALIFAAIALGAQHSVWDKAGGQWAADLIDAEAQRGNVYVAASMQALRISSFMHKPSLLAIKSLIMIGPFLTNSGRFLDAWTLFGTTVRLAQAIGLHRHPKYLDPAPPTQRECSLRQTLWWWLLHMDEQYSMTLGRPLGISGIGDCPPPHELTTDPRMLRFGEFTNHFTILARQILSSDRLTNAKIDDFTDSFTGLLDTMPEMLQFNGTWLDERKELPEWPLSAMAAVYYCKTQTYLILLNRQRIDKPTESPLGPVSKSSSSFRPVNRNPYSHSSSTTTAKPSSRGRPQVLKSAEGVVTAFLFLYTRAPASLVSWTIGQQAFNSSMMLLLDALETGNFASVGKVEQAYVVFKELQEHSVHKLATLAVEKLSWGLDQLRRNIAGRVAHQTSDKPKLIRVSESESNRESRIPHDTVMGNTGMLLLEEAGLQSYAPERFTPFTWAMVNAASEPTTPDQLHQEQDSRILRKADRLGRVESDGSKQINPVTNEVQSITGPSQGSAFGRYCAPSSQEHTQPHSRVTDPASPTSLVVPIPHQSHHNKPVGAEFSHSQQIYSSHSHLGSHRNTSAAFTTDQRRDYGTERSIAIEPPQQWLQPLSTPKQCQGTAAQLRHNSCPSLHQLSMTPPLMRPTYSSPIENKAQSPARDEGYAHAQWLGFPAGPVLDDSEPGTVISPTSDQGHARPSFCRGSSQQRQLMYPCSISTSSTASSVSAVAATDANVEHMSIDRWHRWKGSGAPE